MYSHCWQSTGQSYTVFHVPFAEACILPLQLCLCDVILHVRLFFSSDMCASVICRPCKLDKSFLFRVFWCDVRFGTPCMVFYFEKWAHSLCQLLSRTSCLARSGPCRWHIRQPSKRTTSGTLVKLQVWRRTAAINSRSHTEAIDLAGILCPECRDGVFSVKWEFLCLSEKLR